jgi:hypothetical protein
MGLGPGFVTDLLELKRSGQLFGGRRVIEIGAQQLSDSLLEADDLLDDLFGVFEKPRPHLGRPSGKLVEMSDYAPSSREFWTSLGFQYAALDFDGHRDSVAIDLNRDLVPEEFANTCDLVVNTGTTEHIANQDNCFRVIQLACKGGIMYHEVPAGMTDHGLINYNPRFFWKLRDANDYEVLSMKLISSGTVPIPNHVIKNNRLYGGSDHLDITSLPDITIRASFRKRNRQPFASPLDLPASLMPGKLATLATVAKRAIPWR